MPTVSEFIRLCRNFSMITLVPDRVVNFGWRPVVIGIVRISLPFSKTCSWSVRMLTLLIIERPIVNDVVRLFWPKTPLPAGTLSMSAVTVTLVPGCQYVLGRQCTSVLEIQWNAPAWAGTLVTFRCRWIDSWSVTGTSNLMIAGRPTPTVAPGAGKKLG